MEQYLKDMGVDKLHALGCKGSGVVGLVYERDDSTHGYWTSEHMRRAAPEATVLRKYFGILNNDAPAELRDYVHENNVKIISISLATDADISEFTEVLKELKDEGVIIFCSAGNDRGFGSFGVGHADNIAVMVGSAIIRNGVLYKSSYSAINEELDFMSLSDSEHAGTSFSCPTLAGIAGCIINYCGDMDSYTMYEVFKAQSRDMEVTGHDERTGHGLPVIDIDVLDTFKQEEIAEEDMKHKLELWLDRLDYRLDGEVHATDVAPQIVDGRTMTPARLVAEAMGGTVGWDGGEKKVTVEWEDSLPEK